MQVNAIGYAQVVSGYRLRMVFALCHLSLLLYVRCIKGNEMAGLNMKCDDCQNLYYESACSDHPHPEIGCSKEWWSGMGPEDMDCSEYYDGWDGCKDFVQIVEVSDN